MKKDYEDLRKENQGAILGVVIFLIIGYVINYFVEKGFIWILLYTLAIFLAYILTTQSQIKHYQKKEKQ